VIGCACCSNKASACLDLEQRGLWYKIIVSNLDESAYQAIID